MWGQLPWLSSERCSRSELPKAQNCPLGSGTRRKVNPRPRPGKQTRVGDYRLICDIQDERSKILGLELGHRNDVYR
jgi:mRNA-degrading endonuclease RelE of RelBE toxin-antitoxin system